VRGLVCDRVTVLFLQMAATQAIASGDLADLVAASAQATVYPSDDALLAVLQARFRADLPYSRIGSCSLVAVNPYKSLANVNDASAREYEQRCYRDTALPMADSPRPLQPHLYDLAARLYLLMRRRRESQTVIARSALFVLFFFFKSLTFFLSAEVSPARENPPASASSSARF
jgi:hypothetical protein